MTRPDILCIGAVLWDIIGRTDEPMDFGNDRPGRITRLPGGVTLNIAMAARRAGLSSALLSVVGQDPEGDDLLRAIAALDIETRHITRAATLPTDCYMAVEGPNGLAAACADARSLEQAGTSFFAPLRDGTLADARAPYPGIIGLDGNLSVAALDQIPSSPLFAEADLRAVPASPGKAERLRPILPMPNATLYVNLEEANLLSGQAHTTAEAAATALTAQGARRVLVTNGPHAACDALGADILSAVPPQVTVTRVTGAGDTFMAGHIAAEHGGADRATALGAALAAAAEYISTAGAP